MPSKKKQSTTKTDPKTRILQAALTLYTRDGFAETRMLDIARQAKVSHPLMRYYFPDLDSLTRAVFNEVLESLKKKTIEYIDRSTSASDRLLDYVAAPFDWGIENPRLISVWLYLYYQASFSRAIREQNTEIRQVGRRRIEQILFHGIATDSFGLKPADVSRTALEVHTITTGGLTMAFNENGLEPQQIKKLCQDLCLTAALAPKDKKR